MAARGSRRYLRLAGVLLGACALSACNSPLNFLARLDGPYVSPERRAELAYRAAMERQRLETEAAAQAAAGANPVAPAPTPTPVPTPVIVQRAPLAAASAAAELPPVAAPAAAPAPTPSPAPAPAAVVAAPVSPISPAAGLMGPVATREPAPAPLATRLPSAFELTPVQPAPSRREAQPAAPLASAPPAPAPAPAASPAPSAAPAPAPVPARVNSDLQRAAAAAGLAIVSALPTPDPAPASAQPAQSADALRAFYDFAVARLDGLPAGGRASMLLADPPSLDPELKRCGNLPPAVLIDLDPGNGLLPLVSSDRASPELARYLGLLRERGVTVYWISGHAPNAASQIRQRLVASGLDPSGTDPLIVTRFAGESKQARRYGLGDSNCVLAIMGDQRADFDELYDYVLDPIMAAPLEEHVDHGWFLAPPPLD